MEMPVALFDRGNPQRNTSQAKWYEQIRADHMRLAPGKPGMPLVGADEVETAAMCLAAGAHEIKLPPRGLIQLCKNCRKGTRDSLWIARCGPCGEYFSPILTLYNSCDGCGSASGVLLQLSEHLAVSHGVRDIQPQL